MTGEDESYRARAKAWQERARKTANPQDRARFEDVAKSYATMADTLERIRTRLNLDPDATIK
jgi:hypothetical protein